MTKQIITVAISCSRKECPKEIPESCLECKYFKKSATADVIEVLDDYRDKEELPPEEDKE